MTDGRPLSERDRALANVAECELQFRRAQGSVSVAHESLRRAIRSAEAAEGEFENAARRLSRMDLLRSAS